MSSGYIRHIIPDTDSEESDEDQVDDEHETDNTLCEREILESESTPTLNSLPTELLVKIFTFLPTQSIINTIMHISEEWKELAIHCVVWNVIGNGDVKEDYYTKDGFSVKGLRKVVKMGVKIESLHLKNCRKYDLTNFLETIRTKNMPLHTLILDSVHIHDQTLLFDILKWFPSLRTLEAVSGTVIHISRMKHIDYESLPKFKSHLRRLVITNVYLDERLPEIDCIIALLKRTPDLKHFQIGSRAICCDLMSALSSLKRLESLVIQQAIWFEEGFLIPFHFNTTLKHLCVKFYRPGVIDLQAVSTMTGLKSLTTNICSGDYFKTFLKTLPTSISCLSINPGVSYLFDEHLEIIRERLPHLEELSLNICQMFSEMELVEFISGQKNLKFLRLKFKSYGFDSTLYNGNQWIPELLNHPKMREAKLDLYDDISQQQIITIQNSPHRKSCFKVENKWYITLIWNRE